MDTFGACVLATEIPKPGLGILQETQPFDQTGKKLFTKTMYFTVISQTIYQQIILYVLFYNGRVVFGDFTLHSDVVAPSEKPWRENDFYKHDDEGNRIPTSKCIDYTYVYQTFFMMQMFNLFNC